MKHLLLLFFCLICSAFSFGQSSVAGHPIPDWLLENWATLTQNEGIWITDNSAYKSQQEPYDAYGLHWEYGLGKKHLKGRLYCIRDGKDIGTVWNFTQYWDPAAGEAVILQIGSDGTLGKGKLWQEADGSEKEQQTFTSPEGGSFESGHRAWMEDGNHHTQSYNIVDGKWEKRRLYVWKPKPMPESPGSLSTDFDFMLGEWSVKVAQLKEQLNGSDEWIESPANCKFWKQLNGMVVMDELYTVKEGKEQVGSTYRIFNPETGEWTFYWASTAHPDAGLIPQVKGSFQNGTGTFYGETSFQGRKVKLRHLWKQPAAGQAYWEQAYYDEANGVWETNRTMEFKKKS